MKKIFAILLVLAVVTGCLFATNNDKLQIKSVVGEVLPQFKIVDATQSKVGAVTVTDSQIIASGKDISVTDITWDFIIKQEGETDSANTDVTYAKTKKTATLGISLGHFTGSTTNTVSSKDAPVFTAMAAVAPNDANAVQAENTRTKITVPEGTSLSQASVQATLVYYGVKWEDQNVITFTAKWTKDDSLPLDTYLADITLTYSSN